MTDMNTALINRSLTTVHTELDFLRSSKVITEQAFDQISRSLPTFYKAGLSTADRPDNKLPENHLHEKSDFNNSAQQSFSVTPPQYSSVPPAQQFQLAEAIYDYNSTDSADLPLYRGAHIIVLEKVNPDWWRGRDEKSGQEGIFPSSYVRPIDNYGTSQYFGSQEKQYNSYSVQHLQPQPQSYSYSSPQYYAPPLTPQQAVGQNDTLSIQQQQQQQQQGTHAESSFERHSKKFGKKLGNAAIFGAGATIGSNIVNSIF
ncbi:SH3 domain-containing protein [Lipomyces japonicus]|uniref:SH3 domain-containing protein n=1 Tax=Lipomyces japonicus TaxID=56871 RepID=UPI0034CDBE21